MTWEEIEKRLLDHLATVSDEEFDEELRLAGIENQPRSFAANPGIFNQYWSSGMVSSAFADSIILTAFTTTTTNIFDIPQFYHKDVVNVSFNASFEEAA